MKSLNKKGNLVDIPYIIVLLFIFAFLLVIGHYILTAFMTSGAGFLDTTIIQKGLDSYSILDSGITLILIGLILGTAISAFFIESHPVFFAVMIFFLTITVFVSAQFSNIFNAIATTAPLNVSANELPRTLYVMRHMPKFIAIGGVIISVALFSKLSKYFFQR